MPAKRRILGGMIAVARVFGVLLVALGILGLPQMSSVTGPLAPTLEVLSCIALGLVGIAWLFGVKIFLRFFDQYMSRN